MLSIAIARALVGRWRRCWPFVSLCRDGSAQRSSARVAHKSRMARHPKGRVEVLARGRERMASSMRSRVLPKPDWARVLQTATLGTDLAITLDLDRQYAHTRVATHGQP